MAAARTYERITLGRRLRMREVADGGQCIEACYAPNTYFAPHAHEKTNITLLFAGQLEECVGRLTVQARSLSVVVKPAGTVHMNRFGRHGAHTFLVAPPIDSISRLQCEDAWRWYHSGAVVSAALGAYRQFRTAPETGAADLQDVVTELISVIADDAGGVQQSTIASGVQCVRDRIHDEFPRFAGVSELARAVDLHPVYLARAFRSRFGCTISEYVQRLRVRDAADRISRRGQSLAQVAADAGFADQPHLSRVFKRQTGFTPGQFSRLTSRHAIQV
jgi:AraC family transcriptional regulator